jgi:glycosyltransferase involved in cell wall biosynthesis
MTCDISVVIPVYNEEENLAELYRRLRTVLEETLKVSYEIVFVDDGSKDNSWKIIEGLRDKNHSTKGIRLSRNFGHHTALTAGLDFCKGKAVVLMDADSQDPPEEIPKLYAKFGEGYDVVVAIRKVRRDPVLKRLLSKCFYFLFRRVTDIEIESNAGIFRILSRRVVDTLTGCRERYRFVTALICWTGFSRTGVETVRHPRSAGKAKYGTIRSALLALDGMTAFSYFPLRMATLLGAVVALISISVAIWMLLKKMFFGFPILGYASLIVAITFIGSVQLLVLGIMGEYIGRIYAECQGRPLYIVSGTLGIDSQ